MQLFSIIIAFVGMVEAELELVQVLFRHADRAPSTNYPNDPYDESAWPRGYSQLTARGHEQAKELGHYLAGRYGHFVGDYNRKKIHVRSSDKDRCIETAMGVNSGLFPDQIVPVHTFSSHKEDLLLKPNSVKCLRADEIVGKDKKRLYERENRKNREFFEFVSSHAGLEVSMKNIADIYNAVFRESENGLPQPAWVYANVLPDNMTVFEKIIELKTLDRMESYNSDEKSKLRTGYLLGQLVANINAKIADPKSNSKKMLLFSSHDATLTSLLYNLKVSNHQIPPYASAIIFELHKIDGNYFVQLLYRNSTSLPPLTLQPPGCKESVCSIDDFLQFTSTRILSAKEDFLQTCSSSTPSALSLILEGSLILAYSEIIYSIMIPVFISMAYYFISYKRKNAVF
ncbi:hypothetical protein WR25_09455 [Diploscapter pachys]|uniref:Acid phosphatase n=1 Tax=Diploscapter pachys TaxID=2018661 RepID=A0A2A2LHE5_9BILA|nr:hypothetical protein WR25_09455 [Diploscapter pachys]